MSSAAPLPNLWDGFSYLPHQEIGVKWMLNKELHGTPISLNGKLEDVRTVLGGIQADEMGLGKTIQMVATMRANPLTRTLVLVPVALQETWIGVLVRAGFQVYCPRRKTTGAKLLWSLHPTCSAATIIPGVGLVQVANYEKVQHYPSLFRLPYGRIILDEAHRIANSDTAIFRSVCAIPATIHWAMTGTPIVNSWNDLKSILVFLGIPMDIQPNTREFSKSTCLSQVGEITLHRSMDSERDRISAAPPLPKIKQVMLDFSTEAEAEFYRGVQGAIQSSLRADNEDLVEEGGPGWKFQLYMRLRQISIHPQVYIGARKKGRNGYYYSRPDWIGESTKFQALANIIRSERKDTCGSLKPRYLVFCQFTDEMDLLADYLEKLDGLGLKTAKFSGGMTDIQRVRTLKKAKAEADCFLIQLQSGGCGLNLQEFNRVVFMGPWWTQALIDQAIARAVRIGQKDIVKVYQLILTEEESLNIDEEILKKAEMKKGMLEQFFHFTYIDKDTSADTGTYKSDE